MLIKKRKGIGCRVQGLERNASIPNTQYPIPPSGFTLLELLITLAVIGVLLSVAVSPNMDLSNAQKSFGNTTKTLQGALSTLRNEAMTRNTTTRITITNTAGVYTIDTYFSSAPTSICTVAGGTWTQNITALILDVNRRYELTGTPMDNTCFHRDGTSSGGAFVLSPITVTTGLKTATITMTIATGFLDVDVQ